jgi:glycosyltransferase involved in cell wall biosynthesis
MAGPAIRAWQIAEALAGDHEVILATTSPTCERSSTTFGTESAGPERFGELEAWCTVVLFQGYVLNHVPVLKTTDKVMVVDLYDPLHLEALELNAPQPEPERSYNVASSVRVLGEQLLRGDFFICASDKQRDLWLGFLSAAGRVNPANYAADPSLRSLIDVVAFGLPDHRPEHTRAALKGVVPGIGPDDEVVLWGGGVYDWFDPLTAIRAVDQVKAAHPRIRLFFLGVRHPNPAIEEARTLIAARELARNLHLDGTHVFFNEEWVDYEDRQNFLLEADVAISLHVEHIEAAYSFRTRILDYMWAGLPIVATRGDTFAQLIEREGLGSVVPGQDVDAVAAALESLLGNAAARRACRERTAGIARSFVWSEVLRPLVAFCAAPQRAADVETLRPWPPVPEPTPPPAPAPVPPSTPLTRLEAAYHRGGLTELARAAARYARRRIK